MSDTAFNVIVTILIIFLVAFLIFGWFLIVGNMKCIECGFPRSSFSFGKIYCVKRINQTDVVKKVEEACEQ